MSQVVESEQKVGHLVHALLAVIFAASPVVIREVIIRSYNPEDTMGSGGDVFVWATFAIVALVLGIAAQTFVMVKFKRLTRVWKAAYLGMTILGWGLSVLVVSNMKG